MVSPVLFQLNDEVENVKELFTLANVLVVGAGGIGCEVLKNLVLSGFRNIEIVRVHILKNNSNYSNIFF